jgi:hypothetical protein
MNAVDFTNTSSQSPQRSSRVLSGFQIGFKKMFRFFKRSPYVVLALAVIVVGVIAFFVVKGVIDNSGSVVAAVDDSRVDLKKPLASQTLNKEFKFPLKDAKGKEVSQLSLMIQNAELRDEIIVKGQRATSIKGRVFLIVNLKITNSYTQSIQVNSRDYLRFIINGSSEKLAADIHNDPVEVQAISTKYTRLGLPINDTDKDIVLQIGEITGKKESIKLNLK